MRISDWSSDVCSSDLSFSALTRAQPQGPDLDTAIRDSLARLIAAVEAQPDSLVAALEAPEGWQKLNAIRVAARHLLELLRGPLSDVLGLPMGFNSFDGDCSDDGDRPERLFRRIRGVLCRPEASRVGKGEVRVNLEGGGVI